MKTNFEKLFKIIKGAFCQNSASLSNYLKPSFCSDTVCRNGGTCVENTDDPFTGSCVCMPNYSGI
jgi:hypothetical protein